MDKRITCNDPYTDHIVAVRTDALPASGLLFCFLVYTATDEDKINIFAATFFLSATSSFSNRNNVPRLNC